MTGTGLRIESASLTSLRINDLAGYSSIGIRLAIAKATVEVSSPVDFLKGSPKKRTNPLVDARKFPPDGASESGIQARPSLWPWSLKEDE